ncbi:MAG: hypothetical protein ACLQAT_30350 [Candidatus Binataceae bacterium]
MGSFGRNEQLIGYAKNVVVVPSRRAWDEYQACGAYICQAGRSFQPVEYLAFYRDGVILPTVPKVLETIDQVELVKGHDYPGPLARVVDRALEQKLRPEGVIQKVFILTSPDDSRTVRLETPATNTLRSKAGRTAAFTQNQRYVALDDLLKARTTSELE